MLETLLKLGLSAKEAQVYLALLELGEDTVQNIGKKAQVNRATTYVILEQLMKLGLVSTIERDKKRIFIAEDPSELANIYEEQRRQIETRTQYLDEVMGELKAIYNRNSAKPAVRYFQGSDGLEALDRYGLDQFTKGSELLSVIPIDLVEENFPTRRSASIKERVDSKIRSRSIYTHRNGEIPGYQNAKELREAVYIPREKFPINGTVQIFPEWGVKFFNFNKNNFFGVLIQSPDFAHNMQEIFELAWRGAQK
jgi:sugar-specific transcriptional regulator TrmB